MAYPLATRRWRSPIADGPRRLLGVVLRFTADDGTTAPATFDLTVTVN